MCLLPLTLTLTYGQQEVNVCDTGLRLHTEEKCHVDSMRGYNWHVDIEISIHTYKYMSIQNAATERHCPTALT